MLGALLSHLDTLLFAAIIFYFIRQSKLGKFRHAKNTDGPLIAATGLLTAGKLVSLHSATVNGYAYNVIAGGNGKLIVIVQLNRSTDLHVVGIGSKSGLLSKLINTNLAKRLTRVELEGDFPSSFTMYCTPGREQDLLHLFDPADMARFADFCQAYDFELYHNMVYMSQAEAAKDANDTTWLYNDMEDFIKHNHRFLQKVENQPPSHIDVQ